MTHVEELVKQGYRNFVLFNLPDLSKTPRYQKKTTAEQNALQFVVKYFNNKLANAIDDFNKKTNDQYRVKLFDLYATFAEIYDHCADYGFDPALIKLPLEATGQPQHAVGLEYFFYDDVHVTQAAHEVLTNKYFLQFTYDFNFVVAKEAVLTVFKEQYADVIYHEGTRCCGFFSTYSLLINLCKQDRFDYKHATIETILERALYQNDHHVLKIIRELGWIDLQKNIISKQPDIIEAAEAVAARHHEALQLNNISQQRLLLAARP